jgi:hypothetical protein
MMMGNAVGKAVANVMALVRVTAVAAVLFGLAMLAAGNRLRDTVMVVRVVAGAEVPRDNAMEARLRVRRVP